MRVELRHTKQDDIAHALEFDSAEDLFAAIGYGDKSAQLAATTALALERTKAPPEPERRAQTAEPNAPRVASGVTLHGVSNVLGNRARCCNPLPGDDVVGFVTRGRGIVIHRRDCDNVHDSPEPERWVEIDWGPEAKQSHVVQIDVEADANAVLLPTLVKLVGSLGATLERRRWCSSCSTSVLSRAPHQVRVLRHCLRRGTPAWCTLPGKGRPTMRSATRPASISVGR
jgi:(p)ppGpp synthase/HD superfamily hydrolase